MIKDNYAPTFSFRRAFTTVETFARLIAEPFSPLGIEADAFLALSYLPEFVEYFDCAVALETPSEYLFPPLVVIPFNQPPFPEASNPRATRPESIALLIAVFINGIAAFANAAWSLLVPCAPAT